MDPELVTLCFMSAGAGTWALTRLARSRAQRRALDEYLAFMEAEWAFARLDPRPVRRSSSPS